MNGWCQALYSWETNETADGAAKKVVSNQMLTSIKCAAGILSQACNLWHNCANTRRKQSWLSVEGGPLQKNEARLAARWNPQTQKSLPYRKKTYGTPYESAPQQITRLSSGKLPQLAHVLNLRLWKMDYSHPEKQQKQWYKKVFLIYLTVLNAIWRGSLLISTFPVVTNRVVTIFCIQQKASFRHHVPSTE